MLAAGSDAPVFLDVPDCTRDFSGLRLHFCGYVHILKKEKNKDELLYTLVYLAFESASSLFQLSAFLTPP